MRPVATLLSCASYPSVSSVNPNFRSAPLVSACWNLVACTFQKNKRKHVRYRRAHTAGGTYFFTVNLADRSSTLLIDAIDTLRDAVRLVQQRHPFHIDAIVILPDHLHTIWTLPSNDAAFATRWGLIKATFSRNLPPIERRSDSRKKKGERGIWQRRYWEHLIRNDDDYARHVDYIHVNPVKHGHAMHPIEWSYSSIHRYVRDGILPSDWSGPVKTEERMFGEA